MKGMNEWAREFLGRIGPSSWLDGLTPNGWGGIIEWTKGRELDGRMSVRMDECINEWVDR